MTKIKGGTFTIPTPEQYVEEALRFVGYSRLTNGFLPHSLVQFVIQFIAFIHPSTAEKLMKRRYQKYRENLLKTK